MYVCMYVCMYVSVTDLRLNYISLRIGFVHPLACASLGALEFMI